jgi:hypothetical protein
VTMNPGLWSTNPQKVWQDYEARHGAAGAAAANIFMWAVWTAEGSDYLEKLDAQSYPASPNAPHPDLVDIAHVRWATGNAITAIDLCAALMSHLFCGSQGGRELSLRDFEPTGSSKRQAEVAARRALVPPDAKAQAFLVWVDATLADQRYKLLHDARNPFTHAWLNRHLFSGRPGHVDRTRFEVLNSSHPPMNAREMVVMSASLAIDRVRAFVEVMDNY